jgi:hypothetical protein
MLLDLLRLYSKEARTSHCGQEEKLLKLSLKRLIRAIFLTKTCNLMSKHGKRNSRHTTKYLKGKTSLYELSDQELSEYGTLLA